MADKKKKNRKWVMKAIIGFVAVLLLLTFFSNTIMNMTIPKVIGAYAVRGNLSYTNSATGVIEVENKVTIKGLDGREVDEICLSNYDYVEPGDVILTLKTAEDSEELKTLRETLTTLERTAEYEAREPNSHDYSTYTESITSAEQSLAQANETLTAVQNRDAVIAAANNVINTNQPLAVALEAEVSAASSTLEDLKAQIDAIDAQLEQLETNINVFVVLGTPTPTPVDPAAPIVAAGRPIKGDPDDSTDPAEPSDTQAAEPSDTEPSQAEPSQTEPSETASPTPTSTPTPEPTPLPDTSSIDELCAQRDELTNQRLLLENQLASAQQRLDDAAGRLAEVNGVIESAQSEIETAEALPSLSEAQASVTSAQNSLNTAQRNYSEALINDGISADKAQDAIDDRNLEIEETRQKIADIEAAMEVTKIVATESGFIFDMNVSNGDSLDAKTAVCTIIPDESVRECSVTFSFSAKVASNFYVGMRLTCDSYWIDNVEIVNIKPNPDNPREERLVKCSVGSNAYPGESITVIADRANSDYDHVISSSAINEDNSGTFVYVIESSSGPLGDKYTVRRVDVTVEATDGSMSAISSDKLGDNMIVIRSEEPLHDGDRVRLEDYKK